MHENLVTFQKQLLTELTVHIVKALWGKHTRLAIVPPPPHSSSMLVRKTNIRLQLCNFPPAANHNVNRIY